MDSFDIEYGNDEKVIIKVAKTILQQRKGLSGLEEIDYGMLFPFYTTGKHQMWMKNTYTPLEIIFMNENSEVTEIVRGKPHSEKLVGDQKDTKFVLELPVEVADEISVEVGDSLDFPKEVFEGVEEVEEREAVADLLDEDGIPQMPIVGGERVVSREKTEEIVDEAKNASTDDDLINLGKIVAEEISAQDERGEDYTDPSISKKQYAEKGAKLGSAIPEAIPEKKKEAPKVKNTTKKPKEPSKQNIIVKSPDNTELLKNLDKSIKSITSAVEGIKKTSNIEHLVVVIDDALKSSKSLNTKVASNMQKILIEVVKSYEGTQEKLIEIQEKNILQDTNKELSDIKDLLKDNKNAEWEFKIERDKVSDRATKVKVNRIK